MSIDIEFEEMSRKNSLNFIKNLDTQIVFILNKTTTFENLTSVYYKKSRGKKQ